MAKDNYINFPYSIFEPQPTKIGNEEYLMYIARFRNLYVLYEYLKSNPHLNRDIFRELSSETGSRDFAGKPYKQAVEDLVSDYSKGYEEFLKLQGAVNARSGKIHKYKKVRTVAGGHLNIPAYSAGNPLCYETEERITKPKFVQMHTLLSYHCGTSEAQVFNRAVIVTNILRALEQAGYSVNLNSFELSQCGNELSYIVVELKKHGGRIDMPAVYKSLCNVEFLRRILFRILETMDVQNTWNFGYGSPCSETFVRECLHLNKQDIFIDQPDRMGIEGRDLAADFSNCLDHLNLQDKFDVEKAKRTFKEGVMTLKRKKG